MIIFCRTVFLQFLIGFRMYIIKSSGISLINFCPSCWEFMKNFGKFLCVPFYSVYKLLRIQRRLYSPKEERKYYQLQEVSTVNSHLFKNVEIEHYHSSIDNRKREIEMSTKFCYSIIFEKTFAHEFIQMYI